MNKKLSKLLLNLLTVLCIAVFAYAAHGLYDIGMDYYKNKNILSNVQDIYNEDVKSEIKKDRVKAQAEKTIRTGFQKLLTQNDEVVGWLTIDNTNIDLPILQSTDNLKYLNTNYNEEDSRLGSIFMDYRNDIQRDNKNFILYGHRTKDGSMFEDLTKFLDQEFLEAHQTFTFDTLYESYEAEVFAVYQTMINFNYIQTSFEGEHDYRHFLNEIQQVSEYSTEVEVTADDDIITLSTCDYKLDPRNGRLVVQAKLKKI